MDRRTGEGSGDPSTPATDPAGENLASHSLADPGGYAIAPDETEAEELVDLAPETDAEVEIDDRDQLSDAEDAARDAESSEPLSLAEQVAQSRPKRKTIEPPKKDAPTPSRRKAKVIGVEKRTTPREFVGQSIDELKKVVWPTSEQVRQYFIVVLVFVLFIMAYVVALDTGFGALLLKLFG